MLKEVRKVKKVVPRPLEVPVVLLRTANRTIKLLWMDLKELVRNKVLQRPLEGMQVEARLTRPRAALKRLDRLRVALQVHQVLLDQLRVEMRQVRTQTRAVRR